MSRRAISVLILALLGLLVFATLPIWGMGPAIFFLDSDRTVLTRIDSPEGEQSAQIERIIVGGVPSIVVVVRRWWMPNWYLVGCAAASHYHEADAIVRWTSEHSMEIEHSKDIGRWKLGAAPFKQENCKDLQVKFVEQTK